MKRQFSNAWKASSQIRKQRKYRHSAPLHVKHKFLSSHLSKELITKHGTRNLPIRKGDTVKILRGQFKNHMGKIEKVFLKTSKALIEGAEIIKKDGSKVPYPINPSNILITTLNLEDKERQKILERKNAKKTS
ncbi:MAG: 50S ribosomal protein L24 [Nanoarchaeota archaeon]|jgi:large subunit ribosomal protein L24|nr:50S ribosomal protein L24 [Nanoarchaeota archaeon]|tara:strand:- start:26784 stop:27182 length:399 start_codon:yes stop_codon:yes gene_type:complete